MTKNKLLLTLINKMDKQHYCVNVEPAIGDSIFLTIYSYNGIKLVTYYIHDQYDIDSYINAFNDGQYYGLYKPHVKKLKSIIRQEMTL